MHRVLTAAQAPQFGGPSTPAAITAFSIGMGLLLPAMCLARAVAILYGLNDAGDLSGIYSANGGSTSIPFAGLAGTITNVGVPASIFPVAASCGDARNAAALFAW